MRIRTVLSLGALLLAGGALTGGAVALAETGPAATPTSSQAPLPTSSRPAPTAVTKPAPAETTRRALPVAPPAPARVRVPRAVPAGPTGDLALPAIVEAR